MVIGPVGLHSISVTSPIPSVTSNHDQHTVTGMCKIQLVGVKNLSWTYVLEVDAWQCCSHATSLITYGTRPWSWWPYMVKLYSKNILNLNLNSNSSMWSCYAKKNPMAGSFVGLMLCSLYLQSRRHCMSLGHYGCTTALPYGRRSGSHPPLFAKLVKLRQDCNGNMTAVLSSCYLKAMPTWGKTNSENDCWKQ